MSQVKLTIFEAVVKGYHECSFAVSVGEKYIVSWLSSTGSIKFGSRTREFDNQTHQKVRVRLCSIAEPIKNNRTIGVRLSWNDFSFGLVRLATSGLYDSQSAHLRFRIFYMHIIYLCKVLLEPDFYFLLKAQ